MYIGKRIFDIFIVLIASPFLLTFILTICIFSRILIGPRIFFIQKRPGHNCETFNLYKFRTMNEKTDKNGKLLPDFKRITSFGKFLRSSSLDELPSFLNVLKGEMSLVGPRPLLVDYLDRYNDEQIQRHNIKPGITGWAQVNGRNAVDWDKKFEYDLWYVKNNSFLVDLKVLFLTVKKIFKKEGINKNSEDTMDAFLGNKDKN